MCPWLGRAQIRANNEKARNPFRMRAHARSHACTHPIVHGYAPTRGHIHAHAQRHLPLPSVHTHARIQACMATRAQAGASARTRSARLPHQVALAHHLGVDAMPAAPAAREPLLHQPLDPHLAEVLDALQYSR